MRELSDKDYLLGIVGGGERVRIINFVFLWAKFYIYIDFFMKAYLMYISEFTSYTVKLQ